MQYTFILFIFLFLTLIIIQVEQIVGHKDLMNKLKDIESLLKGDVDA